MKDEGMIIVNKINVNKKSNMKKVKYMRHGHETYRVILQTFLLSSVSFQY